MSEIGRSLCAVRKRLGLSRDKLGALVGVSGDSIRNYELGKSRPSTLAAEKLAEFVRAVAANAGGGE